jgi:pectate lyase
MGGSPGPRCLPGRAGLREERDRRRNNGTVYHVTNLNDAGSGSFRDAVSASNRFVVFDVGGYIQLVTAVSVKSNITIAGQTAPGQGIGFRGGEISFANSSNIICRYIRIRPGSETADDTDDALSLYRARNVMIDHNSYEFAPWNNIGAVSDDWQNYPVTDVTFQDSLIADPTGQQFGAHTESVSSQMAWYRNIFANSHNRNPLSKINDVFVNNLLYNYSAGYTTHTSTNFTHDILNNYFVFGPASTGTDNTWYQVDKNQSIYYAGNLKDTNRDGTLNGAATTPYWYQGEGMVLASPWSTETTATPPSARCPRRASRSRSPGRCRAIPSTR